MSRKAFLVQVELDVQAVTCPGVWLCSNGKVSLQIYMLDSCVQTACYKPNFPIQCNEKFIFYKTFFSKHQLNELEKELHDQWLYIELVQWQNCEIGNILASFQTTLDELLYPSTVSGSIAGVDLDLLMDPSKTFPGTIAPKVEVSTKTTIEETLCVCTKPSSSQVVVNPKVLMSTLHKPRRNVCRKVCHSVAYSRRKRPFKSVKSRPPFCYRRAEDDLILRKPQYDLEGKYCSCRQSKSQERKKLDLTRKLKSDLTARQTDCFCSLRMCSCGNGHKENFCPVCCKYRGYFDPTPPPQPKKELKTRTTLYDDNLKRQDPRRAGPCQCCRAVAFATDDDKSDSADFNASDTEQCKKICSCTEKKPSLAEKLHAKLTQTLSSIPRSVEWSCYDHEYECDCCECPKEATRAELYRDLQRLYGDLYDRARGYVCVPDCPGLKSM
ncbi:uncharacterized protein LOC135135345 isoform X2 [Zophobas morio]|uniref:uncharacterized protein LOC135135345 isoform X2 n=1 Tax=Zophobas morio TaxID=2755281 RepID=UPI003082A535